MAAQSEPDLEQVTDGIKGALKRQKSHFRIRNIFNANKLSDLDHTLNELMKVSAEAVVNGKVGLLCHRHKNKITQIYPMLEHIMVLRSSLEMEKEL